MPDLYKALHTQSIDAADISKPAPSDEEMVGFLSQLPNWTLIEENAVQKLRQTFVLADYNATMDFAQAVADIAESFNHHPELVITWGKCTVTWSTHAINGLHKADFIMAAKTDQL